MSRQHSRIVHVLVKRFDKSSDQQTWIEVGCWLLKLDTDRMCASKKLMFDPITLSLPPCACVCIRLPCFNTALLFVPVCPHCCFLTLFVCECPAESPFSLRLRACEHTPPFGSPCYLPIPSGRFTLLFGLCPLLPFCTFLCALSLPLLSPHSPCVCVRFRFACLYLPFRTCACVFSSVLPVFPPPSVRLWELLGFACLSLPFSPFVCALSFCSPPSHCLTLCVCNLPFCFPLSLSFPPCVFLLLYSALPPSLPPSNRVSTLLRLA